MDDLVSRDRFQEALGVAPVETAPADPYACLQAILAAVGGEGFYATLATQLGRFLGCERHVVMRYSQFAKPAFVANNFMSAAAESTYLRSLYRRDPLYGMVRRGVQTTVLTLRQAQRVGRASEVRGYREALQQIACIYDELAMLLPLFGGLVIAICLDTQYEPFESQCVDRAMAIYPVIQQAHRLHHERMLPGGGYGLLEGRATGVMVSTQEGEVLYKNPAWLNAERTPAARDIDRYTRRECRHGALRIGESMLHGHRLAVDSPICPNGNMFFLETRGGESVRGEVGAAIDAVSRRYGLSPRERDLINMAARGRDTRTIAKQLGLSIGTVKNYKRRLYRKLGVNSEREILPLLMRSLVEPISSPRGIASL